MKHDSIRRMDLHYALLQTLNWMGYAVIWGCMTVLLQYLGFPNGRIGLVSSAAMILSMTVQPFLASLVDRSQRINSRDMSACLAAAGVLSAAALWFAKGSQIAVMILYALIGLILTAMQPFLNSAAMEYILRGVPLNYSTDRSWGSGAYALGILVMGWLLEDADPTLVVPVFIVIWSLLAAALLLFRYPLPPPTDQSAADTAAQVLSIPALLRKYPRFTLLLVGCAFMLAAHSMYVSYSIQLARRAGAGEAVMGISMAIAALAELPAMVLFNRMRRKLSLDWMMRLCALSTLVRGILYFAVSAEWGLYVSAALQFFSYGLFPPVTVYYVMDRLDAANQAKGQSLLLVTGGAVGACVGLPLAGALMDRFGTEGMLWCILLSAAVSVAVVFFATRRTQPRQ